MLSQIRRSTILVFAMVLAASLVTAPLAVSAAPAASAGQPTVEETAPPNVPESATSPASDQKNTEGPSKNGNGKNGKKNGPTTAMLLGLFAVITGHQGATR